MPVLKPDSVGFPPDGSGVVGFGLYRRARGEETGVELHFHDCDEYWFVIDGSIRAASEGIEHIVNAGEALFTKAGDEHALLEILEDTTILWMENDLRGRRRPGHLHRPDDLWP
jgi:mannose-6-phosphate isomerase-like protein (cupin superfamily)